jgi:hypothetical protein
MGGAKFINLWTVLDFDDHSLPTFVYGSTKRYAERLIIIVLNTISDICYFLVGNSALVFVEAV